MSRHEPRTPARILSGADVVLVGLFSAKDRSYPAAMASLAAAVEAHGGRVAARFVQRRGVSHGGVHKMASPFSRRTLISPGKAREVAHACRTLGAGAVVFANPLTTHQREVLGELTRCPVLSADEVVSAEAAPRPTGSRPAPPARS